MMISGCVKEDDTFINVQPNNTLEPLSTLAAVNVESDLKCMALCLCSDKCVAVVAQFLTNKWACTLLPTLSFNSAPSSLSGNLFMKGLNQGT